jgi:hypothetical protein
MKGRSWMYFVLTLFEISNLLVVALITAIDVTEVEFIKAGLSSLKHVDKDRGAAAAQASC